jgi:serine O-acetyltransferase
MNQKFEAQSQAPARAPSRTPLQAQPRQSPLQADFKRYLVTMQPIHGPWRARIAAFTEFGFLATAVYRLGRWSRTIHPRWLSLPVKLVYRILEFFVQVLFGISISTDCEIGPGFYIGHFGGIHLHCKLGADCSIGQGVTIGARGAGRSSVDPVLGDRVYVGAGAMVVGGVSIGDDVIIGANTTVVTDVPAGCRVVSAAARILPPAAHSLHCKNAVATPPASPARQSSSVR